MNGTIRAVGWFFCGYRLCGVIVSGQGWVVVLVRVIVRYFADGLSMGGYSLVGIIGVE